MKISRRLLRLARAARQDLLLTIGLGLLAGILLAGQARVLSRAVSLAFLGRQGLQAIWPLLAALAALALLRAGLAWAGELAAQRAAARVKADVQARLAARLLALGPIYATGERTGELTNTAVEGVEALDPYVRTYLPQVALAALLPAAYLLIVFPLDWVSGLVLLLTAPLIPVFMALIASQADALTRRRWASLSRMSAHLLDVLQGLPALKLLGRSGDQVGIIARVGEQYRQSTMGVLRVAFLSALVLEMVAAVSTAIVAVEVSLRLLAGRMAFEQALFVLILTPEFYLPLRQLGARFHAAMPGLAAGERILQILSDHADTEDTQEFKRLSGSPCTVSSPSSSPRSPGDRGPGDRSPGDRRPGDPCLRGEPVRFDHVSYAYPGTERPALDNVCFEIAAGEKAALVGPSGAGKTTIAGLLLSFACPTEGAITVGGRPLADIEPDIWREQIAWVPQSPTLFYGSVADNIRLGRPDASDAEVIEASRRAHAREFIQALPQGYDTPVGEHGARLSGGEAQRIALARAFLKAAPLVILDEATANLDPETAAQIAHATDALLEHRTALIIAHRRETVRRVDRIVVLDQGRIVDQGTHDDLQRRGGLYARLVSSSLPDELGRPTLAPPPAPLRYGDCRHSLLCHQNGTGGRSEAEPLKKIPPLKGGTEGGPSDGLSVPTGGTRQAPPSPLCPSAPLDSDPLDSEGTRRGTRRGTGGIDDSPRSEAEREGGPIPPWLLRLATPFAGRMALGVLLGLATIAASVGLMGTSAYLIGRSALRPPIAELSVAIVAVRFFGISRGLFRYGERLVSHEATFRLLARLRTRVYAALEPLAPARLMLYRGGDLLTRLVSDVETLENLYLRALAPPAVALLVLAGVSLWMARFSGWLAALLLAFLLLAGVVVPLAAWWAGRAPGRELVQVRAALNATLVSGIQGVAELLAFARRPHYLDQAGAQRRSLTRLQMRMANVAGLHQAATGLLTTLAAAGIVAVAVPLVQSGRLDGVYVGVLALVALASFEAVAPLPAAFQYIENSLEAARRLNFASPALGERSSAMGTLDTTRPSASFSGRSSVPSRATPLAERLNPFPDRREAVGSYPGKNSLGGIAFENVRFSYSPGGPPALDAVNLEVRPGQVVAVVGPSGAGKTTLVNLMVRFWEVDQGRIVLGGRDLRDYTPEEARRLIAVVPQRPHLFNATIGENLRLPRPAASDRELVDAARQAHIHDFCQSLPDGYDTWIGEQGLRLSAGQRQRLAIARALLQAAPILVLDEPTANLDPIAEREVLAAIRELTSEKPDRFQKTCQVSSAPRATLIITHRLAGLGAADEIVVLSRGRIVERGRHADLLARGGAYARMWQVQEELLWQT